MRQDRRGSWYLLTGAVLGVAIGLFYSWVVSPVKYVDAPPYALRADFKDEYRALVAAAYLYSSDLIRAEDRLAQLKEKDVAQILSMQAQRALAEGHPEAEVKALGLLAIALGKGVTPLTPNVTPPGETLNSTPSIKSTSTSLLIGSTANPAISPQPNITQPNPIGTEKPTSTFQTRDTLTSTPTQGAPFILQETRLVCNPDQPLPLIQVDIHDAAGQPVPSVELIVIWNGGEDTFFTGLKPELGLGYADFVMTPQIIYTLHLAEGGQSVENLTTSECLSDDGTKYWGSWMLIFIQS